MPRAATAREVRSSPSSSPIAINSERSSTYFPANGFSITATAAARRVGGEISRSISRRISSTNVAILRILLFILASPQSIFSLDLRRFQAARAGVDAGAGGHHQGEQNFVGARRVVDADFHGVKMAAHVGGVDVGNGHIEASSGTTHLLGRGHDCFSAAENFAHAVSAGSMP